MTGGSEPCAGGIVHDGAGRLLLIRRAHPPAQGSWSVPGGRCRPGESAEHACVREVREETGLAVTVRHLAGRVERAAPGGGTYVIDDFVCDLADGTGPDPVAGDDADDARWVDRREFDRLALSPGLAACLAGWGLLPR